MKKLFTPGRLAAIGSALVVLTCGWRSLRLSPDGVIYRQIAEGHLSTVLSPFAKRVLHPLASRALAGLTGTSVDVAFLVVQVACLVVLSFLIVRFVESEGAPVQVALPLLLAPVMFTLFTDYYLHDLFYAAILGSYLILLQARPYYSLPLLPILFLTRESTLILGSACCVVAWSQSMRRFAVATLLACAVGMGLSSAAARSGRPNIHRLPEPIYYALKIPNNLAHNVFGVEFWTDTQTMFNSCVPAWKIRVPPTLPLGAIREVGFCGFDAERPFRTLWVLISSFGVLPCVLVYAWVRHRTLLESVSFVPACTLFYAALVGVSSLTGGNAPERFIAYAWPVFAIVTPALLVRMSAADWKPIRPMLLWNLAFSALTLIVQSWEPHPPTVWLILIGFAVWADWTTWRSLESRCQPYRVKTAASL